MSNRYVVLVQWQDGITEKFVLPETVPLHIGHGLETVTLPVFASDGSVVGTLIRHGDAPRVWTLTEEPFEERTA